MRLEVKAIPEDEVGVLHLFNIARGGLVGVWIAAGADHGGDVGVRGDIGGRISQVTGRGEDRQIVVLGFGGVAAGAGSQRGGSHEGSEGKRNKFLHGKPLLLKVNVDVQ